MDSTNDLKHYGIKGMKWGRRKDESGSAGDSAAAPAPKPLRVSEDAARAHSLRGKRLPEMTNQELRILNERMQLEMQYTMLNSKAAPSSGVGAKLVKGKAKVDNVLAFHGTAMKVYQAVTSPQAKAAAAAVVVGAKVVKNVAGR